MTLPVVMKLTGAAWKPSEQISAPSLSAINIVPLHGSCFFFLFFFFLLLLIGRPFFSGGGGGKCTSTSLQTTDMEPNNSTSATGRIIHWYSLLGAKRRLHH